jgi:hypothetical protein
MLCLLHVIVVVVTFLFFICASAQTFSCWIFVAIFSLVCFVVIHVVVPIVSLITRRGSVIIVVVSSAFVILVLI